MRKRSRGVGPTPNKRLTGIRRVRDERGCDMATLRHGLWVDGAV